MYANAHNLKVDVAVVAVCENADGSIAVCKDQDDTILKNTLEFGPSFTFEAKYTPPALLLFRLSIPLSKEAILYLQFKPSVISSLAKFTCDVKSKTKPECFNTIQRHLYDHRSFTRLQFKLNNHGDLITPIGFAIDHCSAEMRGTFASITSLATTSAFSLYMPRDALPTTKYKDYHRIWRQLADPTELHCMYKGQGGALFNLEDHDRPSSSTTEATDASPAVSPPVYDLPPQYNLIDGQSNASESDVATIPVTTPLGYRINHEKNGCEPHDVQENCNKRCHSSDSENANQRRVLKRRTVQRQAVAALSQPKLTTVDPSPSLRDVIGTLESRIEDQQQQIEVLKAEIRTLQNHGEDLEEYRNDMEGRQEGIEETLEIMSTRFIELEQDRDMLQEELPEMRQGIETCQDRIEECAEDWIQENIGPKFDTYLEKYIEDKTKTFMADLKRKFRSVLDD
ncbi:uncharacterized protein PG998_002923 [Apiospora kogelbergensis]|uniref:uncharacterized protein n=1 Tax=Apiospora kogelbergensis TaxID=1337665 RepID=UPI00312D50C5